MLIDPELVLQQIYCCLEDFALVTCSLDGRITSANRGTEIIFGYARDELLGQPASLLFTPEDRTDGVPGREMTVALERGRAADFRWHMRKDGTRFWADGVMTPLRDAARAPVGFMKLLRDTTASKLAHDTAARMAASDLLTGVANRASFNARLTEMLSVAERGRQLLLLFAIDLDRFKEVNDQFGHHAGDLLLGEAARRVAAAIRDGDVIARLGGDEFALLQLNPPSISSGAVLAEKMLAVLAAPFDLDGHTVSISGSIGIAVYPNDALTAHDLRIKADLALYQAKRSGRNCFHYFTDAMDDAVRQRNLDKAALRQAVAGNGYRIEYQPIIDATTGVAITMEALIRFPCPRLAAHPVGYAIDLAREIGLICPLGAWLFREACMQLQQWHAGGIKHVRMAVNTCARELLEPAYADRLEAVLAEFGLHASSIDIELTERDAIELGGTNAAILAQLHSRGFRIVLDDFGTGFSALSHLRRLPIDRIKLDRSFVQEVPLRPDASQVVTAVITLANALRLAVTAEGVETQDQANFLVASRCHSLQGYLFARSMAPAAATDWLRASGAGTA